MAVAGGLLSAGTAHATTYELGPVPNTSEAVLSSPTLNSSGAAASSSILQIPDVQIPALDLPSFQDNPVLIVAAVGALLVGIGLAVGLPSVSKPGVKAASPATVLAILKEDPNTIFVDIRSGPSIKESGKPQLKGIKGKSKLLAYTQSGKEKGVDVVVPDFGEKFAKLKGIKSDSTIILLDSDGTKSPQAAKDILKFLEFKTVLYVAGGESAWKAADVGWQEPSKGLKFSIPAFPSIKVPDIDLSGVTKGVANAVGESKGAVGTGLAVGAVAATSFVIVNEIDIILEVVGLFGAVNLLGRNFLFAKQRSKTMDELRTLVEEKIAPQEAGEDLKRLATSVLNTSEVEKVRTKESTPKIQEDLPAASVPAE